MIQDILSNGLTYVMGSSLVIFGYAVFSIWWEVHKFRIINTKLDKLLRRRRYGKNL